MCVIASLYMLLSTEMISRPSQIMLKLVQNSLHLNPERKDRSGQTPLIHAVSAGHINIVKMLLHNSYASVNKASKSGATAFDVALITGKYDIAQMIMDIPDFNVRIGVTLDAIDEDLFLVHCRRLNKEAIKLMIRAGYNLEITDEVRTGLINISCSKQVYNIYAMHDI